MPHTYGKNLTQNLSSLAREARGAVGGQSDARERGSTGFAVYDYYRTSFGTNVHQNNYWASTGIVLRLFGGAE
jgi:hypothetical protein